MLRITYIGEEITAQGFRLLGAATLVPQATYRETLDALYTARDTTDLVLLDQQLAELVRADVHELLLKHPIPPVLVVPRMVKDQDFSTSVLDQARRELGIGT